MNRNGIMGEQDHRPARSRLPKPSAWPQVLRSHEVNTSFCQMGRIGGQSKVQGRASPAGCQCHPAKNRSCSAKEQGGLCPVVGVSLGLGRCMAIGPVGDGRLESPPHIIGSPATMCCGLSSLQECPKRPVTRSTYSGVRFAGMGRLDRGWRGFLGWI